MAIITVMLVLSILAVIGLGIATMGMGHLSLANAQANTEKAYMAAEAAALFMMDEYRRQAPPANTNPVTVRWLDAANQPGTAINAIIVESPPPPGTPATITPPNQNAPITIPNQYGQCAYILGCGTVGNNTVNPTTRYVGMMVRRAIPGGVYYFGAYANTTLSAANHTGVVDAWNSNAFTALYDGTNKLPYVDVEGSGNLTLATNQTGIWGNIDGPTIKTDSKTNFNGFGTARQPGTQVNLPAINWPAVHPSPTLLPNITITSGTVPLPPDVLGSSYYAANVTIDGPTAELRLVLTPGLSPNFIFNSLNIKNGGKLVVDQSLGPTSANIYVVTGDMIIDNGGVNSSTGHTNGVRMFYNGPNATLSGNTKFTGQLVTSNTSTSTNMTVRDTANVTGSLTAYNNMRLQDNASIHYDTSLRAAASGQGDNLSIISHQRL